MYIDAFKRALFQRLSCLRRMCVCQRPCSSSAMSKVAVKKLHWRSKVQENFVPLVGSSGELGVAIGGGADYGEFPFVTAAPGGGITVGDVILEIGGTPVLGMTLGDVRGVLNSCPHPIRIKTVPPGVALCKDLRLYLSKCFTPGSMDSQLQQVIRENLYLRAVPCTTRQPRDGEISGVDYNFVSVEEFFSLEESGALLESGKLKGNYYGTPRPVHIGPESPPITYQEHRNLLRKFRTRCKSLSNLEKTAEEGYNSEEDSGLSGGSGGASSVPAPTLSPSQSRDSSGGDGSALENGGGPGRRRRGAGFETWEMNYSDSGEPYYTDHQPKPASWHSRRTSSRETVCMTELWEFTDQPEELRGYSIHTRLSKGSRGFGFNIVGGSRPGEFLQVYSITPGGPHTLNSADILVYIGDSCVLGISHKEVVELLKSVPVGHSVDVVVQRGYPMLYNPDGCPKQRRPGLLNTRDTALKPPAPPPPPPTTTQPQPQAPLPTQALLNLNGMTSSAEERYSRALGGRASRFSLDANGNTSHFSPPPRTPPYYEYSNGSESGYLRPPRSTRGIRRLLSADLASQSDSEVVSAIGSHRASLIRNHNNNSLCPPSPLRLYSTKSSESDLSSFAPTPPTSRSPLRHTDTGSALISSSPEGGRRYSQFRKPQRPLLTPPPSSHSDGPYFTFNSGASASSGSPGSSIPSPGATTGGGGGRGRPGGKELVPVALAKCEEGRGLGFSIMGGGHAGRVTMVKRVFDRQQCNSLQPGDIIVKINGADVQSLSFSQVQRILQEHTKMGEVILLVQRGGSLHSPIIPNSTRQHQSNSMPPRPASATQLRPTDSPPLPRNSLTPPPQTLVRSSLVQSTSFLDSIPVTLTLEPRDWMSSEDGGTALSPRVRTEEKVRPPAPRGFEVELKRKPGEGFGFVIASQDVENGKAASLLPHRFVTVRRGSPAARSGQIRPGDRLEAVEGRSVVTLPHRELAQILRRAGNTLRLTIVPRSSANSSDHSDYDANYKSRKSQRLKQKDSSRYYSVDLERGPTGFGFSLRGGIEYNMGLYVLGLMEGGPASRSRKIQVSDQLVEINGQITTGMTHSQAVEQIRTAGQRIHLVLKKGNGYVPDYGRDHRAAVSSLPPALQPHLAAVNHRRVDDTPSPPRAARSRSQGGRTVRQELGSDQGGEESPDSLEGHDRRSKDRRRRSRGSQSLSRNRLRDVRRNDEDEEEEEYRPLERVKDRRRDRVQKKEKRSKNKDSGQKLNRQRERKAEKEEEHQGETYNLPIPKQRSQSEHWEEEIETGEEEDGPFLREGEREGKMESKRDSGRKLEGELESHTARVTENEWGKERVRKHTADTRPYSAQQSSLGTPDNSLSSWEPQGDSRSRRAPFSFLMSPEPEYTDSESEASVSDDSVFASSYSGLSVYLNEDYSSGASSDLLPGPWFKPSPNTLSRVVERNRLMDSGSRERRRQNSIS
ncbi:membrane-associated guanylate kinase, WW and PDZ domain-containing protein 3 isoform X2 [Astyanax mexicanus]|uniref:membrane-associated guanylate kinase, WW and PDZ domain-containing protein 3 isoform X2 n=1 Tax=Astyanax mexicanus TaxID=7994 RepID=UPI0020CB5D01|nr:membrane-associated guanylate kinase, WW and PDZ domain-containing protein 3 isoform X2 [Astyanax mexicanus]